MERRLVVVKDPPGSKQPHSIRIEKAGSLTSPWGHPSFKGLTSKTFAIARNEEGFIIKAVGVDSDFLEAERSGGASQRLARIDAADLLRVPQDIVDN